MAKKAAGAKRRGSKSAASHTTQRSTTSIAPSRARSVSGKQPVRRASVAQPSFEEQPASQPDPPTGALSTWRFEAGDQHRRMFEPLTPAQPLRAKRVVLLKSADFIFFRLPD